MGELGELQHFPHHRAKLLPLQRLTDTAYSLRVLTLPRARGREIYVFLIIRGKQICITQTVRISRTPRQSDAVKKLQQLYGTFAAYATFITQL